MFATDIEYNNFKDTTTVEAVITHTFGEHLGLWGMADYGFAEATLLCKPISVDTQKLWGMVDYG